MRLRPALLAGVLAVLLAGLLAGCGSSGAPLGSPHVDVDTPALHALKQQAGIAPCPAATARPAGSGLPDVSLPCLGGGRDVPLARLRGPLVVNLWAQWCHPCRKELPDYQAFSRKYAGKVGVLGVDWMDYQPRLALKLAASTGVTYPLVADQQPRIRATGNALPQVILIDRSGDVVYQRALQITSVEQLEKLVRDHLGVRS